jgi:hypothetical protein
MTKAELVRELAAAGRTPLEIRALTGYDRRLIHKALKQSPVMGRPRKHPVCTRCGGTGHEPGVSP